VSSQAHGFKQCPILRKCGSTTDKTDDDTTAIVHRLQNTKAITISIFTHFGKCHAALFTGTVGLTGFTAPRGVRGIMALYKFIIIIIVVVIKVSLQNKHLKFFRAFNAILASHAFFLFTSFIVWFGVCQ